MTIDSNSSFNNPSPLKQALTLPQTFRKIKMEVSGLQSQIYKASSFAAGETIIDKQKNLSEIEAKVLKTKQFFSNLDEELSDLRSQLEMVGDTATPEAIQSLKDQIKEIETLQKETVNLIV